ncbi:hypothetical protein AAFC00_002178 [Neodothiora populina]|uniref:Uncharacterized protein n=1 Tax=Neodothiora populina TaxID=2781224 RepID=A0ABR3PGJ2_9PEZI
MTIKRKRSLCAFSSPVGGFAASLPQGIPETPLRLPLYFPQSKLNEATSSETFRHWKVQDDAGAAHLNSRTRKRYRDNRPESEQVYATTITKLFGAQKEHPNASPIQSRDQPIRQQPPAQSSTLHYFWRLPSSATTSLRRNSPDSQSAFEPNSAACEDCDDSLRSADAMDLDDTLIQEETACYTCGKNVCDLCAVSADQRRCLNCATC